MIFINSFYNHFGFYFAEISNKPYLKFLIVFAGIASATRRDNIGRNCSWTIRRTNGYQVIGGQWIPKSLLFPTISAEIIPPIQTFLPFLFAKGNGHCCCLLASLTFIKSTLYLVRMGIFSRVISEMLNIGGLPQLSRFYVFMLVFLMIFALVLIDGFAVISIVLSFLSSFSIYSTAFFLPILFSVILDGLRMILLPSIRCSASTGSAMGHKFVVFLHNGEEFDGFREVLAANRTTLSWGIHSVSLSLHHRWGSADGVICRRFGCTALADTSIIPQETL